MAPRGPRAHGESDKSGLSVLLEVALDRDQLLRGAQI